jgi:hypothetical protein
MASDKKPEILGSSPTVSSRVALGWGLFWWIKME